MLELSKVALKEVVDSIPAGIVVIEKEKGKVTYVNERAKQLYGIDPRGLEMQDHSIKLKLQTLNGEVYPSQQLPASIALLTGKEAKANLIIQRPDGSQIIVSASAKPIKNGKGEVIAAVGIFEDITQLAQVEALKDSEQLYRTLFENTEDGFQILQPLYDKAGNASDLLVLKVNKSYERQTGLKESDIVGKTLKGVIPNIEPYWISTYCNVGKTGKGVHFENYNKSTNRWYDVDAFLYKKNQVGALFRDITARKKTEQALKESEKRLRLIVENSRDGINMLNLKSGKYVFLSPAQVKLTGFTEEEINNISAQEAYQRTYPDDRHITIEQQKKIAAGEYMPDTVEYRWKVKSGEYRWFSDSRTLVRDENSQPIALVGISRDITEKKNLEKLLQEKERMAAIGQTAGMVGHDIRNPLQAIVGDLYLLEDEVNNIPDRNSKQTATETINSIAENIEYINKIVQDLQDYARPINPKIESTEIKPIIEKLLTRKSVPTNVNATVIVEDEAKKIQADSYYLNRILYNLVTNAIQAMPKGGKLTIHAFREANDVVITIKDTGVGIPKEIRDKMFTLMFTTKAKGQGFGLPVVKRMTESLGGTVSFESQEGEGTTFTVRLPPPKELNGKLTYK